MEQNYKVKRGDICWIDGTKVRPAIIVSNDDINAENNRFEVVYLTTRPKEDTNTHVTIRSAKTLSTALCERVTTVSTEKLQGFIGACTPEEMTAIDVCIAISLGLRDIPEAGMVDWQYGEGQENEGSENEDLYEELIATRAEADLMHRMYNELLEKTLS